MANEIKAPKDWEVVIDQLMTEYLNGYRPAASFAESDRTFTTQEAYSQVIAMYPSAMISEIEIYNYLLTEEYAPKWVGDGLRWCAKKI